MIKKFVKYDDSKLLKYKDLILDKVNYYNFILPDNSNFIANGMVVESLNKNNKNWFWERNIAKQNSFPQN